LRELDKEYRVKRNETLRIKNETALSKLKELNGELISRKKVEFFIQNALAILRGQILRLPLLIISELRGEDYNKVHTIKLRIEQAIDSFLDELSERLEKAADLRAALAALEREEEGSNEQVLPAEAVQARQDAVARKKIAANETRRAKRRSKQQAHGH
jgi:hypothetical protein